MSTEDPKSPEEGAAVVRDALARAEELRQAKTYKEAITVLVEALRYGTEKAALYYRLGNVYFDAGDLARAEYAYQRALTVDPEHVNAMHNLAVVYKRQRKISQFVKTYKRSQKLDLKGHRSVPLSGAQASRLRRLGWRTVGIVVAAAAVILILVFLLAR